jgi:fatty-acid peroxygenase
MIDLAAAVGPGLLRGRLARARSERWIGALVEQVRDGSLRPAPGSPLAVVARYREGDRPLPVPVAAVEVINLLRPIVAIARFLAFAALALHEHPDWRERVARGGPQRRWFVQEVRRFYPFFPAVAARVRDGFEWQGYHFPPGRRVFLDLYATDHDPRLWPEPDRFRPERFGDWDEDAFALIPQGGGDHHRGHRCPGEDLTIAVLEALSAELASGMDYRLPPQDLAVSLSRMPAQPASGVVIAGIRWR